MADLESYIICIGTLNRSRVVFSKVSKVIAFNFKRCIMILRYFELKHNADSDYKWSPKIFDAQFNWTGDSAANLYAAYARICGILRKAKIFSKEEKEYSSLLFTNEPSEKIRLLGGTHENLKSATSEERNLLLALLQFPDVVETTVDELMPSRLVAYVHDLLTKCKPVVEGASANTATEQQIKLLELTRRVLKTGFHLIGFEPLERL
jgi:arginyl-tRNA synthetase